MSGQGIERRYVGYSYKIDTSLIKDGYCALFLNIQDLILLIASQDSGMFIM